MRVLGLKSKDILYPLRLKIQKFFDRKQKIVLS
jgi:hypothetical protein